MQGSFYRNIEKLISDREKVGGGDPTHLTPENDFLRASAKDYPIHDDDSSITDMVDALNGEIDKRIKAQENPVKKAEPLIG